MSAGRVMSTAHQFSVIQPAHISFSLDALWIFPLEFSKFSTLYQCKWRQEGPHWEWKGNRHKLRMSGCLETKEKQHSEWLLYWCSVSMEKREWFHSPFRVQKRGEERSVRKWKEGRRVGKKYVRCKQVKEMEDTGTNGKKHEEKWHHSTGHYTVHLLVWLRPSVKQARDFAPFSERNSGFLMTIKMEWQSSVLTTRYSFL